MRAESDTRLRALSTPITLTVILSPVLTTSDGSRTNLSAISDKEYVETLTVFGQKVETWERMDAEIKNVVVGKVLSITRHENSDHMWI